MGRVITPATIENLFDLYDVSKGLRKPEEVRRVEVSEALVDTGATMLMLPRSMIEQLGLQQFNTRKAESSHDSHLVKVYQIVQLTIQDRQCPLDVGELPDGKPVLIGQIPLERLDFIVDPKAQKIIPNPRHGGEFMIEV